MLNQEQIWEIISQERIYQDRIYNPDENDHTETTTSTHRFAGAEEADHEPPKK